MLKIEKFNEGHMMKIFNWLPNWIRDRVDSMVAAENSRLESRIEKLGRDISTMKFNHERELRGKGTEIEILRNTISIKDEEIKLLEATVQGEYERRKSEIAAHIGQREAHLSPGPVGR